MKRRNSKRNYGGIFLSIFIALLMITSIIGFLADDSQVNSVKYGKYKFTTTNNGWHTKIDNKDYYFSYTPADVELISVPENLNLDNIIEVDVTSDINSTFKKEIAGSMFELNQILSQNNIYVRQGQVKESDLNLPIITCAESTQKVPVILYRFGNETRILYENNCIILESRDGNSFLALTHRIAFKILKIM